MSKTLPIIFVYSGAISLGLTLAAYHLSRNDETAPPHHSNAPKNISSDTLLLGEPLTCPDSLNLQKSGFSGVLFAGPEQKGEGLPLPHVPLHFSLSDPWLRNALAASKIKLGDAFTLQLEGYLMAKAETFTVEVSSDNGFIVTITDQDNISYTKDHWNESIIRNAPLIIKARKGLYKVHIQYRNEMGDAFLDLNFNQNDCSFIPATSS